MPSAAEVYRRKQEAKVFLASHIHEYETATELAEACADRLGIYEDFRAYKIPEWVFEAAADMLPEK